MTMRCARCPEEAFWLFVPVPGDEFTRRSIFGMTDDGLPLCLDHLYITGGLRGIAVAC